MAFNGAGIFVRLYNWANDAANSINITASRMDAETDGIGAGLSNCITRDGQGKPSAAIDWNGQALTNVAAFSNTGNTTLGDAATDTLNVGAGGLVKDANGRLYGTTLHDNASLPIGIANQYIASGTYTPAVTNSVNVTASTPRLSSWMRVGNVVTVSGSIDITPASASYTLVLLTLPIPLIGTWSTGGQCAGAASTSVNLTAAMTGDIASSKCGLNVLAPSTAAQTFSYSFTYVVV